MEKIVLIIDSVCDISVDIVKKNNIKILFFKIIFFNKEYDDGIDIILNMFYELLKKEIFIILLFSVDRFINVLNEVKNVGYIYVIIIIILSGFLGVYNVVRLVVENVFGI